LGLTAFLSGQRTAPDGRQLSWRYPLAEIGTVLAMLITFAVKQQKGAEISDLQLIFWLVYMAIFVLIVIIDVEHHLILYSVIIPSCALAILDAVLTPAHHEPTLGRALWGGALGFGVFFLLYLGGILYTYISTKLQGRDITEVAFGYGDVMLATLSGLMLGLEPLIFAIFITVFLGALGALLYIIGQRLAGRRYSLFTALPYGPYIVAGTAIMLLFAQEVRFFMAGY
jgi:prepilin signal peptidase PulO-like enzyme (type II secretory pathway)